MFDDNQVTSGLGEDMGDSMSNRAVNIFWFLCGLVAGLMALSLTFGDVRPEPMTYDGGENPSVRARQDLRRQNILSPEDLTDDTGLYRNVREARSKKVKRLKFDRELSRLARMERRYNEPLPLPGRTQVKKAKLKKRKKFKRPKSKSSQVYKRSSTIQANKKLKNSNRKRLSKRSKKERLDRRLKSRQILRSQTKKSRNTRVQ